ncbi:MAG: hypothetical protein JO112_08510 [Planctomycetes bacterium]|nr:hypothetical protein [Planctomycetota bacterium]
MLGPPRLEAAAPRPATSGPETAILKIRLEDALASSRRLWVRGRLIDPAGPIREERKWWERWRRGNAAPLSPTVHLETRVSGGVIEAEVPLQPDGRFEATLPLVLPLARRGWRVARHRVTWSGHSAEACGVVLESPREARSALLVLLPLSYTYPPGSAQQLASSEAALALGSVLRSLEQGPTGRRPLFYLACVPAAEEKNFQAELALATTSLGWPAGNLVLLPAEREGTREALSTGLDRLRWLFAGQLEFLVLNLEPSLARGLPAQVGPAEDRALVRRLVNPEEDPWNLLEAETTSPSTAAREEKDEASARPEAGPGSLSDATLARVLSRFSGSGNHQSSWLGPRPTRAGLVPRYPLVFCHGMLAFTMLYMQLPEDLNCFSPLKDFFRQRGFRVLFPQVPPTSGVVERAARLRDQILAWTEEPVNLIAHSMGGLDARYLITHLGMAGRVRSLTTICTPHRGTFLADWFLANFRQRVPLLLALEAFGVNVDGFRDCRPAVCRTFNAHTPDRPEVRYFSYGGEVSSARVSPMLRRPWHLLTVAEGPNDGMVSVASARWGEYLGTIHADHFAQTPDAIFLRPGEDFDSLGFFSRLVEDLARRGF